MRRNRRNAPRPAGRGPDRRPRREDGRLETTTDSHDLIFIERARPTEPIVVEVDRPMAFRPRLVGFWRGTEFYQVTRMIATRREHDATYHRVLTDRGAVDVRHIRRMDPMSLRARRVWELCAELDAIPVARLRARLS